MATIESSIKALTDEEILRFWKSHLWKDRTDPVRAMSSMLLRGGYDMQIYNSYKPYHLGLFVGTELIGSNSCHSTSETEMRSRGLFILEEFRGTGLSKMLFAATEACALKENRQILWSYPRRESLQAYLKSGFSVYPDSPATASHCYVSKKINA